MEDRSKLTDTRSPSGGSTSIVAESDANAVAGNSNSIVAPIRAHPARPQLDRKSTRLNSSHGYISYAVFCLKKKKTKPHHTSKEDIYKARLILKHVDQVSSIL